jgi:DnaJ-class molecular chaperone
LSDQPEIECPYCGGTGKFKQRCRKCGGSGVRSVDPKLYCDCALGRDLEKVDRKKKASTEERYDPPYSGGGQP